MRPTSTLIAAGCTALLAACTGADTTSPATDPLEQPAFGKAPAAPPKPTLAYGAEWPGGVNGLWVANADGSNSTRLVTTAESYTVPSWAPGGTGSATPHDPYRLVFEGERCRIHRVDVIIDATTGRPSATNHVDLDARFDVPATSCNPEWSPNGDRIVFADGARKLWMVDPEAATAPVPIYEAPEGHYLFWSAWSPDGSRIAFIETLYTYPYPRSIKMLTVATGEVVTVLSSGILPMMQQVDWSPVSETLVVRAESGRNHSFEIWTIDVATGQYKKVQSGADPGWSPDGTQLVFTNSTGKLSIYTFGTGAVSSLGLPGRNADWRR